MMYTIVRSSYDSLAHYGITGQRWGVRRYQNLDGSYTQAGRERYNIGGKDIKDINKQVVKKGVRDARLREAHTIPKGTMIYRTSASNNELDSGTTYISYLDVDRAHYKGGWIRNQNKGSDIYENSYVLKEDLNVPSRDEAMSVVNAVMEDNKDKVRKTVDAWVKAAMPESSFGYQEWVWNQDDAATASQKTLRKRLVDEQLKRYGELTPNQAAFFVMQSFGVNPEIREKVIKELSSRGYNAMTDEASVGGQGGYGREGVDPIIVFDRSNMFGKVSSTKINTYEDDRYNKEYNDMMRRSGYYDKSKDEW